MSIKRMGGLIHRETANFRLLERRGRFYVECLRANCLPRTRRISRRDVDYLTGLKADFDHACVLDFGCGWYAGLGAGGE